MVVNPKEVMRASLLDFQGRALQAEHRPEVEAWWYIQEQQDSEGGRSGRECGNQSGVAL